MLALISPKPTLSVVKTSPLLSPREQLIQKINSIIPEIQLSNCQETVISMRNKALEQQESTLQQLETVLYAAITARQTIPSPPATGPSIGTNGLYA